MEQIKFEDLQEKETYIVSKAVTENRSKYPTIKTDSEFEASFEFEQNQMITILKIEEPFFVIRGRHGREFVKLSPDWIYQKPSKEFVKSLNRSCEEDYY